MISQMRHLTRIRPEQRYGACLNAKQSPAVAAEGLLPAAVFWPSVGETERYEQGDELGESRFRKSAQDDKWSFCLTAGTLCPANQEKQ
jgi:hypothetical protein